MAKIDLNTNVLVKRIANRLKNLEPDINDPKIRAALLRIGFIIERRTKLNIKNQKLIDTGRLINSIRSELFKEGDTVGVRTGSFGVPYAAVHEFGFNGIVNVRAHQRLISKAFGRVIQPTIVEIKAHARQMMVPKREYLKPAYDDSRSDIIKILQGLIRG